MFYESELFFAKQLLKRHRIPIEIIDANKRNFANEASGVARLFGVETKNKCFRDLFPEIQPKTIYRIRDLIFCTYIYMLLPDTSGETVLFIGPYTCHNITPQGVLEKGEQVGLNPREIKSLEFYLSNVPYITDENYIFTLLDTLGEIMWGEHNYSVTDIDGEDTADIRLGAQKNEAANEDTAYKMQIMERRYALEREIMDAVAHGQQNKAEIIMAGFSSMAFERRLTDQLRNLKNYCIIMNTLLRKAAEDGGVHPIYIDSVSSEFAKRVETLPNISAANDFMREMFKSYCMLVKRKSTRHYSPLVQRTIVSIDTDLTADLSLNTLAAANNVSASYFSTLFKRETGQTLTEYVNARRIEHAKMLLKKTYLQVQTVAQHCGIYDVHYFSKLFKKHTGKTPKEYRENSI